MTPPDHPRPAHLPASQTLSPVGADDMSTPDGPLVDVLTDPGAAIGQLAADIGEVATRWTLAHTAVVAVLLTTVAGWRWWRSHCRARLSQGARVVTIVSPPQVNPTGAAAFWARMTGLLRPVWQRWLCGQPHLVFEYAFDTNGMRLRLWVPGGTTAGLVERAVEAAWPGAQTRTTPATFPLAPTTGGQVDHDSTARPVVVGGGQLRLARTEALPIRAEFPADPLRGLYGAPGPLRPGEHAVVQILARPVTGRRANAMRRGSTTAPVAGRLAQTAMVAAGRMLVAAAREVLDLLTSGPATGTRTTGSTPTGRPGQPAHLLRLAEQSRDRAIVAKQIGPRFETLIRYATTVATDPEGQPDDRTHNVPTTSRTSATEVARGRSHAIASAFEVVGAHNHYRRRRLRHPHAAVNGRRFGHGDVLSVDEVATLAHLPTDDHVTGLARAGANAIAPPPGTPGTGPHVRPLGDSDAAGRARPVGLAVADARQHLHVLGATGSGKSELLAQLTLADAAAGRGAVVVDPKGDLVTDVLSRLPDDAGARVVLFDAGSKLPPPCLNPLQTTDNKDNRSLVVDQVTSIFSRVYADSWGPRTDDLLRVGLLTLTAQPETPTLAQLPRLLTDPGWRYGAVAHVTDPELVGFWTSYEQMSDAARMAVIAPLMNKLRGFLLKPFVRAAIAAGPSTVTMSEVLDRGGLCLVRIPAGTLGAETAHLVGSLIVAETWQAATARTATPQHQRADASLYLDEAHHFLNLPYPVEDMLAAARGYRLSMTLAHQNLAQLPGEVAEAISTNARTKIWFSASPEDARRLARHTGPHLSEHDLSHLGAFQAAVRPVVDSRETTAFTIATRKLPPLVPGRARQIRAAAAHRSGPPEPARPARRHPATLTAAARATTDPRRRHRP